MKTITLSAKQLGEIKMNNFCERCFWLKHNYRIEKDNIFYSPMPGVFSVLDQMIKDKINSFHNIKKNLPDWLIGKIINELKVNKLKIKEIIKPDKYEIFLPLNLGGKNEIVKLTGKPDGIWRIANSNDVVIVDFKVAKYSETQENLLPLYETQLNAYALLFEKNNSENEIKVKNLFLIYLEPNYCLSTKNDFGLKFNCVVKEIKIWKSNELIKIIEKAASILNSEKIPKGKKGCLRCKNFDNWFEQLFNKLSQNNIEK